MVIRKKIIGDKGYISKNLFQRLFVNGIQLMTKLKNNIKRAVIETINDELKNIAQIEHSRHRSFDNFLVNMLGALAAYCFFEKKPCIKLQRTLDKQLTLF